MEKPQTALLPAEMAVLLLAEFILTPEAGFQQLAEVVSRHTRVVIEAEQLQALFKQHGLKKTV